MGEVIAFHAHAFTRRSLRVTVKKAPAEFIIATMTAFIGFYTFPLAVPLAHRFGRKVTVIAVLLFSALSMVSTCMMVMQAPFDAMHPKRLFVVQSENVIVSHTMRSCGTHLILPRLRRASFTSILQARTVPRVCPALFRS